MFVWKVGLKGSKETYITKDYSMIESDRQELIDIGSDPNNLTVEEKWMTEEEYQRFVDSAEDFDGW